MTLGTALHRATIGLFVAPLAAAALLAITIGNTGIAGFSLMILYPVTLVLVLPVFLLFRRFKWLRWWHACVVGGVAALLVAPDVDFRISRIDAEEISSAIAYLSVGFGAAFVFWCIAVFREPAYPYLPRRFPILPLVLGIVLVAAGARLRVMLEPQFLQGKIAALLPADHGQPRATVQLDDGAPVQADMLCYSDYAIGDEVRIAFRHRSTLIPERYSITDKVTTGKFDSDAYLAKAERCMEEAYGR